MAELYKFVEDDPQAILDANKAAFNSIANRSVGDADPEMLFINHVAYRETLLRNDVNYTGNQNLLNHASGAALDEYAAGYDVYRIDKGPAIVTVKYNLSGPHLSLVIPKGNRVKTRDGKYIFQTTADVSVPATVNLADSVEILCECLTDGKGGNGYVAGDINTILDPLTELLSVENTDTSQGGSDVESDDELRERVRLVRSTFSVTGPEEAYEFWAKSASAAITDAKAVNTAPGEMTVYVLLENGVIPNAGLLAKVLAELDGKKRRPQCDTVLTAAPTVIPVDISFALVLRKNAVPATLSNALARVQAYKAERLNTLGLDLVVKQVTEVIMQDRENIYDVIYPSGFVNIIAQPNEYIQINSVSGTINSIADE